MSKTIIGNVAAGAIANVPVSNLDVIEETSIRLSVTGTPLRFYAATGNMDPPGAQYADVLPGQIIQKPIMEMAEFFGFDSELEDFLNVQNTTAVAGHWGMKFENLGS